MTVRAKYLMFTCMGDTIRLTQSCKARHAEKRVIHECFAACSDMDGKHRTGQVNWAHQRKILQFTFSRIQQQLVSLSNRQQWFLRANSNLTTKQLQQIAHANFHIDRCHYFRLFLGPALERAECLRQIPRNQRIPQ